MIAIKQSVFDQIVAHAHDKLPNEACGYLAGKEEGDNTQLSTNEY